MKILSSSLLLAVGVVSTSAMAGQKGVFKTPMAAVKGTLKADYKGVKWAGTTLSPTGIAKQLSGVSIAKVTGIGQRPIVVNTLVIDQVGGWRASVTSPASAAPTLPELEQKWGPTQQ